MDAAAIFRDFVLPVAMLIVAVVALWKERATTRREMRALTKEHREEVAKFFAEINRLNDERHKLAERRGEDTAQALERTTNTMTQLERVVRDNTATMARMEKYRGKP